MLDPSLIYVLEMIPAGSVTGSARHRNQAILRQRQVAARTRLIRRQRINHVHEAIFALAANHGARARVVVRARRGRQRIVAHAHDAIFTAAAHARLRRRPGPPAPRKRARMTAHRRMVTPGQLATFLMRVAQVHRRVKLPRRPVRKPMPSRWVRNATGGSFIQRARVRQRYKPVPRRPVRKPHPERWIRLPLMRLAETTRKALRFARRPMKTPRKALHVFYPIGVPFMHVAKYGRRVLSLTARRRAAKPRLSWWERTLLALTARIRRRRMAQTAAVVARKPRRTKLIRAFLFVWLHHSGRQVKRAQRNVPRRSALLRVLLLVGAHRNAHRALKRAQRGARLRWRRAVGTIFGLVRPSRRRMARTGGSAIIYCGAHSAGVQPVVVGYARRAQQTIRRALKLWRQWWWPSRRRHAPLEIPLPPPTAPRIIFAATLDKAIILDRAKLL